MGFRSTTFLFLSTSTILFYGCSGGGEPDSLSFQETDGQIEMALTDAGLASTIPVIKRLNPVSGNVGTSVAIVGEFQDITSVQFGDVEAASFSVSADGKTLTAIVPNGFTTATLHVQNSVGSTESAQVFGSLCNPTIKNENSLVINDLSVVEDPVRTVFKSANPNDAVWSFPFLITQMLPAGKSIDEFLQSWFDEWDNVTSINGFTVKPRLIENIMNNWPKIDGKFDLEKAPFRLLAITSRTDLRSETNAGEGRFIFGVVDPINGVQQFTVILEYKLPIAKKDTLDTWIQKWQDLSSEQLPSDKFNSRLARITKQFSTQRFNGIFTNGNAIGQVRTNEIALASPWEMREFRLDAVSGLLKQTTTAQTPDSSFNKTATLDQFMLDNSSAILDGTYVVPTNMLAGATQDSLTTKWKSLSNTVPEDVRHQFSLGTCNSCHSGETATAFTHISPRESGAVAAISAFLTGDEVRRADDLKNLIIGNLCTNQLVSKSEILRMPRYHRVH